MGDVVIVDHGMGNIRSVEKAFEACGCTAAVSRAPEEIARAAALVVPGVGSFGDCAANLDRFGLREAILDFLRAGRPYLGICLGLQILFPSSEESPGAEGLGLFEGAVRRFPEGLKVPHMGWNTLSLEGAAPCPLFRGIGDGTYAYFVHSYYPEPADGAAAASSTEYGVRFASALCRGPVMATQFHPEKSQRAGLAMVRNFVEHARAAAP
ncbi:MAG: imidazole glycerol phosphate synthase subunit HisH [bacterium]|nr:imidazole glycerol phosphate synthase subunit HisH [bacterium]